MRKEGHLHRSAQHPSEPSSRAMAKLGWGALALKNVELDGLRSLVLDVAIIIVSAHVSHHSRCLMFVAAPSHPADSCSSASTSRPQSRSSKLFAVQSSFADASTGVGEHAREKREGECGGC